MAAPQNFVSVSRRPPDVEDYIDILRRYRSWIVGPTFAGLVISVVAAYFAPDVYVCSATMQIRPSSVSAQLLPSAINGQMQQRLQELELQIEGRDNLITLLQNQKLNLYPKERARYALEDVAEEYFRKNVNIRPYFSDGTNGAQAFKIIFSYPDKNVARAVVTELVGEFQSKDVVFPGRGIPQNQHTVRGPGEGRQGADGRQAKATGGLHRRRTRVVCRRTSSRIRWKCRPGSRPSLQISDRISQERQRQSLLDSNLNNNKNLQAQVEANLTQAVTTPNQAVRNTNLTQYEQAIASKQSECVALENKYQQNYPDVVTCKEQMKTLEDRKAELERADSAPPPGSTTRVVTNPEAARQLSTLKSEESNIRAQIGASVQQVQALEKNFADQSKNLREVQDKIASSPQVFQKYNQLFSELQMAKDQYTSVSTKQETAGTQQSAEEHQVGERLEILEQAITPDKPTSPIRGAWVAIGTVIGLFVGIALAGAKEIKNTSLKNLKDVRAYTNLPVLSSIPLLENALLVRRKRRLAWLAWSSAIIVGTILMSGAMYYHFVLVPQV
jgi:uncharacterized membrane protein YgdD (TMEM256/DUF423 family)